MGELRESDNLLEKLYPYKNQIVAVGIQEYCKEKWPYPEVTYVQADGRYLPFKDNTFDFVYSNAVIEHVGSYEDQRRFVAECYRVAKKGVFISTPNRYFILEVHTRLPFVGWLPRAILKRIVDCKLGKGYPLNPLSFRELRGLFPENCSVRIIGQRFIPFWPHAWIAIAMKTNQREEQWI